MPVHTVTLTGVDGFTRYEDMRDLSQEFPFLEFGVLLDFMFAGRNTPTTERYPPLATIAYLAGRKSIPDPGEHVPRIALHLCGGRAIEDFMENVTSMTAKLARRFDRVQLNADFARQSIPGVDWSVGLHKPRTIIMQHGDYLSPDHWNGMRNQNHAVLFDTSQGMGRLPGIWPAPLTGKSYGYAGGLSPDNIGEQLPLIEAAASGQSYWIDMETSLRDPTTDRFCLTRCRTVLQKVKASGLLIPKYA